MPLGGGGTQASRYLLRRRLQRRRLVGPQGGGDGRASAATCTSTASSPTWTWRSCSPRSSRSRSTAATARARSSRRGCSRRSGAGDRASIRLRTAYSRTTRSRRSSTSRRSWRPCEASGVEVGFAQDADADRLAIIDESGSYLGEEYTLALAAKHILATRRGPVAANLSTSRMIDDVARGGGREGASARRSARPTSPTL